mmetsp:Transcript_36729/g.77514  ORF Transcript_36729/g.77514 Transcript_36729/m.77514 type:complete len:225 (+) Transcript_36729:826-1500(+)
MAHFHEVAHVDFLEGGEGGGGVLRFFESGGDALAHTRHFRPALGTISQRSGHGLHLRHRRLWRCRRRLRSGRSGRRRRCCRRSSSRDRLGSRSGRRSLLLRRRRLPATLRSLRIGIQSVQPGAHIDDVVHLSQDFHHVPPLGSADVDRHLVRFEDDDDVVLVHVIARRHGNVDDGALRDGIAHGGDLDGFDGHEEGGGGVVCGVLAGGLVAPSWGGDGWRRRRY